jgi:N4-gp56 family major capsid protein
MLTNFNALTDEQKTAWSMDMWRMARNYSFINKFLGKDENAMIQHITELTETEKGARAVLTLVADLEGDGVAGDRTLEGNEEPIKSYDQVITIDQLRNANRHKGRMADQASVVRFRENSRNNLAYWLSDRCDQLAFLTLAGRSYDLTPNGAARANSELPFLEFAADVTAPTSNRTARWNATSGEIEVGGTEADIVATDFPSWNMFIETRAYLKDQYVRGIRSEGGDEFFHVFMTPQAIAKLKKDTVYVENVRNAQSRSNSNPLFSGAVAVVDGMVIHEFRHVPNCSQGISGSTQWGAGNDVEGCQVLFCGSQSLGMADIGSPYWEEKGFDYENQQGISIGKMFGLLKPQFNSIYANNTVQDFGVMSVFVAQ